MLQICASFTMSGLLKQGVAQISPTLHTFNGETCRLLHLELVYLTMQEVHHKHIKLPQPESIYLSDGYSDRVGSSSSRPEAEARSFPTPGTCDALTRIPRPEGTFSMHSVSSVTEPQPLSPQPMRKSKQWHLIFLPHPCLPMHYIVSKTMGRGL